MYSFAQRSDTRVVDEPLYGHYLRVSEVEHPGRSEVMAAMDLDGARVMGTMLHMEFDRPLLFMKHMAHHLVDLDTAFLGDTINIVLIRDPEQMLPSLCHQLPRPELRDTGLARQTALLEELAGLGQQPPVLDARERLMDPRGVLEELCARIGISFEPAMLSWPAGPMSEDGIWARHWYHNVHRSTGFQPYRPRSEPFPERLQPLLETCRPYYERLYSHAIRARPTCFMKADQ